MTIQEALKTGLPYKRKVWHVASWQAPLPNNRYMVEDILADDWEVKREPREWLAYQVDGIWELGDEAGIQIYRGTKKKIGEVIKVREVLT